MNNHQKRFLQDILTCVNNIESYLGADKQFGEYDSNSLLQDAVERNLITIGEALNALLKLAPDTKITNARKIVDTRNKLTHGYNAIENLQIWNIIMNSLPTLKKEVEGLLNE